MAGYTSDYLPLAHGTPNWDAQLRNDLSRLQAYLQETGWSPGYGGGSGATLGNNSSVSGFASKEGSVAFYFGQFVFGSSSTVGDATVTAVNLFGANVNQTFAMGEGWYKPASGSSGIPRKLFFIPSGASTFQIMIEIPTGLVPLKNQIPTATQSDQILFKLTVPLA